MPLKYIEYMSGECFGIVLNDYFKDKDLKDIKHLASCSACKFKDQASNPLVAYFQMYRPRVTILTLTLCKYSEHSETTPSRIVYVLVDLEFWSEHLEQLSSKFNDYVHIVRVHGNFTSDPINMFCQLLNNDKAVPLHFSYMFRIQDAQLTSFEKKYQITWEQ